MRYAYWNGWERVDDVTAQTATIRKCDVGQVIQMNLAAKTYAIYNPAAEPTPGPRRADARTARSTAAARPAQPGTGVAALTETTRGLGSLRFESTPATGYDTTTTFAMRQSTGSCHDGNATIDTLQYLSGLARPTVASCPIRRPPVPTSADEAVSTPGGCRPTFSANRTRPDAAVEPSRALLARAVLRRQRTDARARVASKRRRLPDRAGKPAHARRAGRRTVRDPGRFHEKPLTFAPCRGARGSLSWASLDEGWASRNGNP